MAHAYTPGLRVTRQATICRERRLPLKGDVVVHKGDRVSHEQVVARTELPGEVSTLNLVNRLGVTPSELPRFMLKKAGDRIAAGEAIAETRPFIKWFKTIVESPVDGTVESVSRVTGQVILRGPARPVEVVAYVDGTVVDVMPGEGVRVESRGAFVQGIFGVGGECWGALEVLADSPEARLDPGQIDDRCGGKIIVGGAVLTQAVIERAQTCGAVAVIGGCIRDHELRNLLGYDLGVAITGSEDLGITIVITEGFGEISMAQKTFSILRECSGREASVSGATQIRAGVQRPEIVVPDLDGEKLPDQVDADKDGLQRGDMVRAIRVPHFGRIGRVTALPVELQRVESEALVRILEIEFEDGRRVIVPRANVEVVEE